MPPGTDEFRKERGSPVRALFSQDCWNVDGPIAVEGISLNYPGPGPIQNEVQLTHALNAISEELESSADRQVELLRKRMELSRRRRVIEVLDIGYKVGDLRAMKVRLAAGFVSIPRTSKHQQVRKYLRLHLRRQGVVDRHLFL